MIEPHPGCPLPKLPFFSHRQIKSSDLSKEPETQCSFSQCFHVQHWAQFSPQELINLCAILSLLPCPARLTERERRERNKGHKVQSNTPQEFSPTEWEYCGAAQTDSSVCVPTKVPRGAEEKWKSRNISMWTITLPFPSTPAPPPLLSTAINLESGELFEE